MGTMELATTRIRKKRRRRGRSFAAFLLFPCLFCCHGPFHPTAVLAAADDAYETETPHDPETDLWLDAPEDYAETLPEDAKEPPPEEETVPHHSLTMEEELQLHAEHQHNTQERIDKEKSLNEKQNHKHHQFMEWCQKVLGIQTSLEIHTFYYYDYMAASMTFPSETDNDDDDDNVQSTNSTEEEDIWQDPPLIPVRGLRATRNISQGEVIISIPFQALLTVSTTIDQDPVLSRVMGKEARQAYGWTLGQDNNNESVDFFELPLLAMALLHHYKLGTSSPLYPYIHILRKSPLDQMPFLWNKQKRQTIYGKKPAKGIQTVARSIRLELKDMYHTVVDTLVQKHPDLFGRERRPQYDTLDDEDWAFSFENFQWAFAMVNSRHWLLPIQDMYSSEGTPPSAAPMKNNLQPQGSVDGVPPAEMPTEAWLGQQEEEEEEEEEEDEDQQQQRNTPPSYHSFLAPVADLLNFGPPCTRGRYNQETHTFDIMASCDFVPGQEVTFWYSDECEDIVIGNYGFTHPMVPKCPTAEDYRLKADKWKQRAVNLQDALEDAYEDMDVMDTELQHVQQILANCDCCDTARAATDAAYRQQHQQQEVHTQQWQGPEIPPASTQHQKQKKQKQKRQPQGNVDDGLHGNYLRNPHDAGAPSQIRGGGGTMMSRSGGHRVNGSNSERRNDGETRRPRGDPRTRSSPRGRTTTDDDVERHGVRRMWAGRRSAL